MIGLATRQDEFDRKYFKDNQVFRLIKLEPTECWFGFIYTKNLGDKEHCEELTPKLAGIEVFGRS
jgi:hypothetical protein